MAPGIGIGFLIKLIVGVAVTVVTGFVARALAPKPPKPGLGSRQITVRNSAAPWTICYGLQRTGGVIVFLHLAGTNNEFLYMVIVWCYGGPDGIESIDSIYFGDVQAVVGTTPQGKYSGYLTVENYLGTDAQTASPLLTTDIPAKWTSDHRLRGHAYSVFRLKWNQEVYGDWSMDNIRAQLKGRKVLDVRTGTVAYSTNPMLCARDFAVNTRFGPALLSAEMNDAQNGREANLCDELVSVKAGGTRARYALATSFSTLVEPGRALQGMLAACGGSLVRVGGQWEFLAAAWRPPMVSLGDDDLRDSIELTITAGRRAMGNGIRGTFTETTHWQQTQFPSDQPWQSSYLQEDDNVRVWDDLDLAAVTDAGQCQQLAKMRLEILRRQKRIILRCKLKAFNLKPGDTFQFTHARFGWTNKVFLVERVTWAILEQDGGQIIGVDIAAREDDALIYVWNPAVDETTFTAPPSSTLPEPLASLQAQPLALSDNLDYTTGDDGVNANTAFIRWSWPDIVAYIGDLTTRDIADSADTAAYAVPGTPALSEVAGGALGARTRHVRTALVKDGVIYGISASNSLAVSANNLLKVTSPAADNNYDGWIPLVGSAANGEMTQPGQTATSPVAFGTDWTEPSGGATVSARTPYSAWNAERGIVAPDLANSTAYYFYPFWDAQLKIVRMHNGVRTAKNATDRIGQLGGRWRYRLSEGAMAVTTPALAGSGSGSDGGGEDNPPLIY